MSSIRQGSSDAVSGSGSETVAGSRGSHESPAGVPHAPHHEQLASAAPRIDPRISIAYKTGDNSNVSLAYGKFQQATNDDLLRIVNDLDNEKSTHYILNYQYLNKGKTFRIEGYYKNYQDLAPGLNHRPVANTLHHLMYDLEILRFRLTPATPQFQFSRLRLL